MPLLAKTAILKMTVPESLSAPAKYSPLKVPISVVVPFCHREKSTVEAEASVEFKWDVTSRTCPLLLIANGETVFEPDEIWTMEALVVVISHPDTKKTAFQIIETLSMKCK